jgi:CheY-like chemotaxis protein
MIIAASYGRVCQSPPFVIENPLRILLAEDDDRLAELVGTILNGDGRFIVLGRARTGNDAVALCEEHEPDIVLMDIGMPGSDGIAATSAIHACISAPGMRVPRLPGGRSAVSLATVVASGCMSTSSAAPSLIVFTAHASTPHVGV